MGKLVADIGLGKWIQRVWSAILLTGRSAFYIFTHPIDWSTTLEQMKEVGPASLLINLITAAVIGMIFTIQVAREFLALGASSTVGGILAIALARELSPIMVAVVIAGRVGSAFAAEIGTMQVTEQIDALYMLKTDPVGYLVVPRLLACCIMLPMLTILALFTGLMGGLVIAQGLYGIADIVFLDSIKTFLSIRDVFTGPIKGFVFGVLIAIIGCNWGLTTTGGAKGVGRSTTAAVVTSLLAIFIFDFILTWMIFQGTGEGGSLLSQ